MACSRSSSASTEDAAVAKPVHVQVAEVTEVEAPLLLPLTGTLKGMKQADLAANTTGRVLRTFVEIGDEVKPGTVVAQLDTSAATLSLAEARVQVATSKTQEEINQSDCARYERLKERGAVSPFEYDQVAAKCKTAPLGLEAARARQQIVAKNVGDGTIRAPFAGVISERYVEVGEYVQASSKVVSIVQGGDLRLEFTVPEADVAKVSSGADLTFTVAAYDDKAFHGKVRFVSGAVRASTRDLVAEAIVSNGDKLLRPGMFANVSLLTGSVKRPSVPLSAVFERQDQKHVYVLVGGQLQERALQPGPEVNGRLTAQDGVKVGDKVVVGDLSALHNGARAE